MALSGNELMRKLLHMSVGGIAFAMVYLGSVGIGPMCLHRRAFQCFRSAAELGDASCGGKQRPKGE